MIKILIFLLQWCPFYYCYFPANNHMSWMICVMEGVICWGIRGSEKYGWWKFKQFYNKVCSYNHKGFKVIHLGLPLLLNDKFSKFVIREEIQEFFYLIKSWVLFLRYWLFSVFNIPMIFQIWSHDECWYYG